MPLGTIIRWISGDDPNKEARAAEREQQEALNTQTSLSNQYNRNIYLTDKKNYEEEREYAYETAITNWEYGKQIQDYQYAQSLAVYEKSKHLYEGQLGYNAQASSLAISDQEASIQDLALSQAFQREAMYSDLENQIQIESSKVLNTVKSEGFNVLTEMKSAGIGKLEQGAKLYGIKSGRRIGTESIQQTLNEITNKNTFEKEAKFVESLQKGGKAALGQAGVSRAKSLQSTAAESFRDLVALNSSLSGSRNKAAVDLLKLQVDASIAETQVGLNLDRLALGVSTAKGKSRLTINAAQDQAALRINAAKDEVKYNNRILAANMRSAASQMERNIQQIQLQKQGADLQAEANLNLFPQEFDYAPEPQMPPERGFVEPPEYEAPTVPKGPRVATGLDSVLGVIDEAADLIGQAMGLGKIGTLFGGKNNVLGSLTNNTFGTSANPGVNIGNLTDGGPFPTNIGSITGNNIGNFGGGTSFFN
jgi:hypothetical protein